MTKLIQISNEYLEQKIYQVRGQKVMLDSDLAELYGVETKVLNQAVKRNSERFPASSLSDLSQKSRENPLTALFFELKNVIISLSKPI